MINIAVAGNRVGWTYEKVKETLDSIIRFPKDSCCLISGGAEGVDSFAQRYAKENGLQILIIYPDWNKFGKSAGFKRNESIAEKCDILIAFDKESVYGTGTSNTIKWAKKFEKEVIVIR